MAPKDADKITGGILGNLSTSDARFEDKVALIRELHAETRSEKMITAFLHTAEARKHPDLALPLLDQVSSAEEREKLRHWLKPDEAPPRQ